MEVLSRSEAETEAWGVQLAAVLEPGTVAAFRGSLGMGKTAFIRGLARGLGYGGRVTSPTFTIVNEYEGGRLPLFHFDLYRLPDADALFDIGWDDYLDRGGVCAVEWSEQAAEAMPPDCVWVQIRRGDGETSRRILIEGADRFACADGAADCQGTDGEANGTGHLDSIKKANSTGYADGTENANGTGNTDGTGGRELP